MKLTSINRRSFSIRPIRSSMLKLPELSPRNTAPVMSHFLAGRLRSELPPGDLDYLEAMVSDARLCEDRELLIERGQKLSQAALLLDGFAFRTIDQGEQRSIVGINVPGDFVDLHGFALKRLDHGVVAAGKARVALIDHAAIERALVERPALARALWFSSLLDAAIHRKWIEMLGRLDAPRRIAHIFCELHTRLGFVGRATPRAVRTPFTQFDLADMCGVSTVHANRAVSKLREVELAEIRRGTFYPLDWEGLHKYAQFDPSYLFGQRPD